MLYEFGSYDTDSDGNHLWPSAMNFCDSLKTPNVKVVSKSVSMVVILYCVYWKPFHQHLSFKEAFLIFFMTTILIYHYCKEMIH